VIVMVTDRFERNLSRRANFVDTDSETSEGASELINYAEKGAELM
jgi:hypothetical protein